MTIYFACGHSAKLTEPGDQPPVCACGERRIAQVEARAPKFRGFCQGPTAVRASLQALPVMVAPDGPLKLKEQT